MAFRFRKQKENTYVPEEVQQYYTGQRRERTGLAWLMALGTLLVTLLIAAGLFFAGRWAYRAIVKNDNKPTTTQTATNDSQNQQTGTSSTSTTTPSTNTSGSETTSSTGSSSTTPSGTGTSTTTPSTTATTTPGSTTTAGTGTPTTLADTGPGDVAALFLGATFAGTAAHYVLRRRIN